MLEKQHGLRTVEASLTELDWLRQVEVEAQSTRLAIQWILSFRVSTNYIT